MYFKYITITNAKAKDYSRYGGRGITISEAWLDFRPFMEWALSNGYEDNLTIDRIDTNGDYSPDNCRWTDWHTQSRNTRSNRWLPYKGELYCISDLERMLGFSKCGIYMRLRRGWTLDRALSEPKHNTAKRSLDHVATCR